MLKLFSALLIAAASSTLLATDANANEAPAKSGPKTWIGPAVFVSSEGEVSAGVNGMVPVTHLDGPLYLTVRPGANLHEVYGTLALDVYTEQGLTLFYGVGLALGEDGLLVPEDESVTGVLAIGADYEITEKLNISGQALMPTDRSDGTAFSLTFGTEF